MNYFLNLFSPETHAKFSESDRTVSGFRPRQRNAADKIQPGDILVCYMTKLSRWVGLLRVEGEAFEDSRPIFSDPDPFVVRLKVSPIVWLPADQAIPIHEESVWPKLSLTRDYEHNTSTWTGFFRNSLNQLTPEDGALLDQLLREQARATKPYPLSDADKRKVEAKVVRRAEGEQVAVSVPDDNDEDEPQTTAPEARESIKVQALLAEIGGKLGMKVWIPANDRAAVTRELGAGSNVLTESLPLNYDNVTLGTIERIDVLWLKGRSIARAFEVEHTTAIYSGLLRMADLLSLQPNMDIRLHIVAPEARRNKVFEEIQRPVFSLLERGPLSKMCTYLSYDSVSELSRMEMLAHAKDSIVDAYAEDAE